MAKATLVEGQSYWVRGIKFEKDVEREVTDELATYLKTLPNFKVEETKKTTTQKKTTQRRTTKVKKEVDTEKVGE